MTPNAGMGGGYLSGLSVRGYSSGKDRIMHEQAKIIQASRQRCIICEHAKNVRVDKTMIMYKNKKTCEG